MPESWRGPTGLPGNPGNVAVSPHPGFSFQPATGRKLLAARAGRPLLVSLAAHVFLAAALKPELQMSQCMRRACAGGGVAASAFPRLTGLPSQPFSKAKTSFLDVPVEGPLRTGLLREA